MECYYFAWERSLRGSYSSFVDRRSRSHIDRSCGTSSFYLGDSVHNSIRVSLGPVIAGVYLLSSDLAFRNGNTSLFSDSLGASHTSINICTKSVTK